MYFHENQLIEASEYLKKCLKDSQHDEDYCEVPQYFDIPDYRLRGLTVRAEYKDETFHILITPHWECFRYELMAPDYAKLLGTSFLVDKIKELFQEEKQRFCVKVDNKHDIYCGDLDENIEESKEEKCFYYRK